MDRGPMFGCEIDTVVHPDITVNRMLAFSKRRAEARALDRLVESQQLVTILQYAGASGIVAWPNHLIAHTAQIKFRKIYRWLTDHTVIQTVLSPSNTQTLPADKFAAQIKRARENQFQIGSEPCGNVCIIQRRIYGISDFRFTSLAKGLKCGGKHAHGWHGAENGLDVDAIINFKRGILRKPVRGDFKGKSVARFQTFQIEFGPDRAGNVCTDRSVKARFGKKYVETLAGFYRP